MRSRTGCLTCRQRKLKCDEQKPNCGQCQKANRDCQPSSGIVFRHQQNASMNGSHEGLEPEARLKGFYAYKNTFGADSVWLKIPKQVTFVNTTDPYADVSSPELDASYMTPERSVAGHYQNGRWEAEDGVQSTGPSHSHGLEALSAAASAEYNYVAPQANMTRDVTSPNGIDYPHHLQSPVSCRDTVSSPSSQAPMASSTYNLNSILNPATAMSPVIDPNLSSAYEPRRSPYSIRSADTQPQVEPSRIDSGVVKEHEVAYLLRHFAEVPGHWMDLFDLGTYFGSHVPVRAVSNPLLRYGACALAAKQLGQIKGIKATWGGVCQIQAHMELWQDAGKVDWSWYGAKYYDKAISLLMDALGQDQHVVTVETPLQNTLSLQPSNYCEAGQRKRQSFSHRGLSVTSSDELLAATAILCVYEFLDASGAAWSRHLSGTKSLLDVAEFEMNPLEVPLTFGALPSSRRQKPSKARRATFWNFARQDMLAAFINGCQTRLNTEDIQLWREAGLLLDANSFVLPSNTGTSGYPEGDDEMKEDMISNALVWLVSKLVNYLAAGDDLQPTPAGYHSDHIPSAGSMQSVIGVNQKTLLDRWNDIRREIEVWHSGLPSTFLPCAVVETPQRAPHESTRSQETSFPEMWYSIPMCASTMQSYHMASILLLINKPHESTIRRTTISNRLHSYQSIPTDVRYHSSKIIGIALGRSEDSVRIHGTQPLFVAGETLTEPSERRVVLRLLRAIESDLGWATEYRVQHLLNEWGWMNGEEAEPA